MRRVAVSDPTIVLSLQDEIRRSPEARYDHRLYGLLMIAYGMSCPEVAAILGGAPMPAALPPLGLPPTQATPRDRQGRP